MGTVIIGSIIDRARNTLFEVANVRWNRTGELLDHANAAQRAICALKPDAFVKSVDFTLEDGAKQSIPNDGAQFCKLNHNLGSDGLQPSKAITITDFAFLGRIDPDWMIATGYYVEHFVHDERDPKTFWVYPRPTGSWHVNLTYFAVPPSIQAGQIDNTAIAVDDLYDTPIHDFIVGYALLKNTKAADPTRGVMYLNKFASSLGPRQQIQWQVAPMDTKAAERVPGAPGKP